ncbi:hypothetical protein ACLBKU_00860 [Erythrobacter sp. NE805]|uniref:hypothetical protein n=1 Tax=Erythrobacter sp. NE805 TaxID=3389875 RepID=UPI00396AF208
MEQVGLADWPEGLDFALAVVRDDAVPRFGLRFEACEEDGLGLHFVAIVRTEAGLFALRRGVGAPAPGTQVWCVADGAPTAERIAAFCRAVGIDQSEVTWRAPSETVRNDGAATRPAEG